MKDTLTLSLIMSSLILSGASYAIDAVSVPMESAPTSTEEGFIKPSEFVPGEIIVVFEDDVTSAAMEALVADVGGEIAESSVLNPSRVVISVPEGREDKYVDAYSQLDNVRAAEKNYVFRTQPESKDLKHKTSVSD